MPASDWVCVLALHRCCDLFMLCRECCLMKLVHKQCASVLPATGSEWLHVLSTFTLCSHHPLTPTLTAQQPTGQPNRAKQVH
jgi:hypothetical protein